MIGVSKFLTSSSSDDQINEEKANHVPGDNACLPSHGRKLAYSKARSLTGATSLDSTVDSSSHSSSISDGIDGHQAQQFDVTRELQVVLTRSSGCVCLPLSSPDEEDGCEFDGDLFFDCVSQDSSSSIAPIDPDHETALYVDGMCVYSDGRPAFVPPGTCAAKVPFGVLEYCDFDEADARAMWERTKKWRREEEIWKVHTRPNVCFDHSKRYYPSCYHGFSKDGVVLEYSYPGQMQPKALFPNKSFIDDMLRHHHFMLEYVCNCLYTDVDSWKKVGRKPMSIDLGRPGVTTRGVVVVIDVKGAGPQLLNTHVFTFIKRMLEVSCGYYPDFADRVLIINSPFWVSGIFATIRPMLPDILPVDIVSEANTLSALRKYVDEDQIPTLYGGSCPYPLHQHPFELRLHECVQEAASYGNKPPCWLKPGRMDVDGVGVGVDDTASPTSTSTLATTATFSRASSVDEHDEDKPACFCLPLCGGQQSRQTTFSMEEGCIHQCLFLTPHQKPSYGVAKVAGDFWGSLLQGFHSSCGRRTRAQEQSNMR
jgi:CRAL/TRIO domain